MIYVKMGIPYLKIDLDTGMEAVAVRIFINNLSLSICSLYIPPDYNDANIESHLTKLVALLPKPFLICTDANAHHVSWGSACSDRRGKVISRLVEGTDLVILNSGEPTHIAPSGTFTHIDLSIATADLAASFEWEPQADLYNSDHFPISIHSNIDAPELPDSYRWNVKKADWRGFQGALNLRNVIGETSTKTCENLVNSINIAAKAHIPQTCCNPPQARCRGWWTRECARARMAKNRALSRYKRHRGSLELFVEFKKCRAIFRKTVNEAKRNNFQQFVEGMQPNTNSTKVWNKVKALSNNKVYKSVILKEGKNFISESKQVAECFAQHFATISNGETQDINFEEIKRQYEGTQIVFSNDNSDFYNREITDKEVKAAIASCKSRTTGPDAIPFEFFKQFNKGHIDSLVEILNSVFKHGVSEQWRESVVVPILKPNKIRTDPNSYRPIALTNCICKIMEKVLNWRLQRYLEFNSKFSPYQSGFRAAHSTLDALTRVESVVRESLMQDKYVVAVFLDICHAFDTVWHQGLMLKLLSMGIKGNLARFICSFMQKRQSRVKIRNTLSNNYFLKAGVPQGSVISPTLFTIYINDIFKALPKSVSYSLYADDGAFWITGTDLNDLMSTIQESLLQIEEWSHKWGLELSVSKTKAIIFTHKVKIGNYALTLNNKDIEIVKRVKFLGVYFDSQLNWRYNIQDIADKCQRDLQLLRVVANSKWGGDFQTIKMLYMAMTRPKLEYACFLYDTAAPTNLILLDRIQYQAIRIMLGALKCTNIHKLEPAAQIMPLAVVRKKLLSEYICRILTVANHPVRNLYVEYYPYDFYINNKRPLSAIGRAHLELTALNIKVTGVPIVPQHLRHAIFCNPVCSSLAIYNKSELIASHWRQLFADLVEQNYLDRTAVYCDGSVAGADVGCGFWSSEFAVMSRLPNGISIFSAELYSLYTCVEFLSDRPGHYLVVSDSLSSIRALQSSTVSDHYLVIKIGALLEKLPKRKIVIEWVPSHMGIFGNERADELAHRSLTLQRINGIPFPKAEQKRLIGNHYHLKWQQARMDVNVMVRSITPTALKIKIRKYQVVMSRLQLGVCLFTHGHHIYKTSREPCPLCKIKVTIEHVLIQCPLFETDRKALRSGVLEPLSMTKVLGGDFPHAKLMHFLERIGYINKI